MHINRHFRAGAPPVINPLGTAFPNSTSVSLAHNLTLIIPSGQSSNVTLFNVTHPKPGDWFLAAHLPKDEGKIEQQVCVYMYMYCVRLPTVYKCDNFPSQKIIYMYRETKV